MPAIEVSDLRKVYHAGGPEPVRAVDGLSFAVPEGKVFGLLGPNGAGKSTVVKVLTTLSAPTSGRASVCGFDPARQGLEVRKRIAVVLQQTAVDTFLTVEDNLKVYGRLHGLDAAESARRTAAVLEEFGLGPKSRETAQDLSLGTKRRLQVAKAFMTETPVLFLDECTTGMDPIMRRRVLDRVRGAARGGRTVLLTTQVLSEAEELCDTILIIDRGRALASGTLADLRRLSKRLFRVSLAFEPGTAGPEERLRSLGAEELKVEGDTAELLFRGEEASLLGRLADLSRDFPVRGFEVKGAGLEDVFLELVGGRREP